MCSGWDLSKLHSIVYDSSQSLGFEDLSLRSNSKGAANLNIHGAMQVPLMIKQAEYKNTIELASVMIGSSLTDSRNSAGKF